VIDRPVALAMAALVVALVAAQDLFPMWKFAHTEPYAVALAVAICVLAAYALRASSGRDGDAGRRLTLVAAGALLIAVTGLASGLLGPDTQTLVRAPGTVAPLPDLGVAVFFPNADAQAIARGDATIVLRRRSGGATPVRDGGRRLVGTAVLASRRHLAAFVEAFDANGRHLTITQPTNPAFLSPVLQFPQTIAISGQTLPSDSFATPAVHRQVTAVYISAKSAEAMNAHRLGGRDVVLFSVRDDHGHQSPQGIGVVASGSEAQVGDLRLRATIGSYPELIVGSAPHPLALAIGGACIALGLALAYVPRLRGPLPAAFMRPRRET
jgi:hypothetical protein